MTQRLFTLSCLMTGGLLVKCGAPFPAVAAGMALAGLWNWKRDAIARCSSAPEAPDRRV